MNRRSLLLVSAAGAFLASAVLLLYSPLLYGGGPLGEEARVEIRGKTITVEVADEPGEQTRGLMFRDTLPEGRGMLFVFDKDGTYAFWMMNVKFSLDIIWIDGAGRIVHIEPDVPPCSVLCPSYTPKASARYVLEVTAGLVDRIPIQEGDPVIITLPTPEVRSNG